MRWFGRHAAGADSDPVRKKKKQINPVSCDRYCRGGVVAIPVALLILLWLPGSLRRDPLLIGKQIGEYAPFLVPADFRPDPSDDNNDETSNAEDNTPSVANKKQVEVSKPATGGLGGDAEPEGKSGLGGSQFDERLKEGLLARQPTATQAQVEQQEQKAATEDRGRNRSHRRRHDAGDYS
jgi:hypothetical protein